MYCLDKNKTKKFNFIGEKPLYCLDKTKTKKFIGEKPLYCLDKNKKKKFNFIVHILRVLLGGRPWRVLPVRNENKSIKTKYEALMLLEKGTASKDVANKFGITRSTLSTWKSKREKIVSDFKAYGSCKRHRGLKKESSRK